MLLHKFGSAVVRPPFPHEVKFVASHLRERDVQEILAAGSTNPYQTILTSVENSLITYLVLVDDVPSMLFGVVPFQVIGGVGFIWMVGTDNLHTIPISIAREAKRTFIPQFLEIFPELLNLVHYKNIESLKLLQWCGAEFFSVYNHNGEFFIPFKLRRGQNVC